MDGEQLPTSEVHNDDTTGSWNGFDYNDLMEAAKNLQAKRRAAAPPARHEPSIHTRSPVPTVNNIKPRPSQHRVAKTASQAKLTSARGARRLTDSYRPTPAQKAPSQPRSPADKILEEINRQIDGFAHPTEPIINHEDAVSLDPLLNDRRIMIQCGRQLRKRVVNFLDKLCTFLAEPKWQPELRYQKGDENSEEYWNRAAQEYTRWLRPDSRRAKLEGSVMFKLMSGLTRLRKEELAAKNRAGGSGGDGKGDIVPGLAAPESNLEDEQVQDADANKIARRLQGGIDRWILYLDAENEAAIDPSIFAKFSL